MRIFTGASVVAFITCSVIAAHSGQMGQEWTGPIQPGLSDQGLIFPAPNTIAVGPQDVLSSGPDSGSQSFVPRAQPPGLRSFQDQRGLGIGLQGSSTTIGPQSSEPVIGEQGSQPIVPGLSDRGLIYPMPNTVAVAPGMNSRLQGSVAPNAFGNFGTVQPLGHWNAGFFPGPQAVIIGPQGVVQAPQGFGAVAFGGNPWNSGFSSSHKSLSPLGTGRSRPGGMMRGSLPTAPGSAAANAAPSAGGHR